jgi:hypothetical protein
MCKVEVEQKKINPPTSIDKALYTFSADTRARGELVKENAGFVIKRRK